MGTSEFQLLGHDCPLGIYPAPVVPVGRLEGRLVAVYLDSGAPQIESLDETAIFIKHNSAITETLHAFNYRRDRLFALTLEFVVSYRAKREAQFFRALLGDPTFASHNPFTRLSLAKALGDPRIFLQEMQTAAQHLSKEAPDFLETWYAGQVESLSTAEGPEPLTLPASYEQLMSYQFEPSSTSERHEALTLPEFGQWIDSEIILKCGEAQRTVREFGPWAGVVAGAAVR